jgi:protein-S-isoprenylcysteine O-methyltransferase Ste14
MRTGQAAAGTAVFFAAAPGVVCGVIPWLLTGWEQGTQLPYGLRPAGALTVAIGALLLIRAFVRFVAEGAGTPAPVAPTDRLVVGGMYRWVRNPMYLAVLATILGQALLLGRPVLLAYASVVAIAVASFVRWYEEPTLAARHGAAYDDYRRTVPPWLPRRPPRRDA